MTNSTDNTETKEANKKPKKKGPIRFEAIIPVVIIFALGYGYFSLFFDANLRQAIEFAGTHVHGAEVNVGDIKTSFIGGYFQLKDLQVTDKEQPAQNLVQIDKIRFDLLWDALLRAKFVVENATIANIQVYSPRKKPGRIIPPDTSESKMIEEVENSVLDQAKDDFNENVLGDVANVVAGADPSSQLKNMQADLKADQKIKELEKALDEKKKLWDQRLKDLPQKKEIDALSARAKKLKFKSKDPRVLAKELKELDQILKAGDKIVKDFKSASSDLKSDVGKFNGNMQGIDKLAQQDIKDLQNRLKIPSLNVADFSKGLFGRMFGERLGKYKKYMVVAREYMPEEKSDEEKAAAAASKIIPKKRKDGRNFKFPVTKGYPLFWLKEGLISSEAGQSEFSGNISGEIKNVTNDPVQLGQPTTVNIEGDFPKQGISGLKTNIIIDHTTDSPYEKMETSIAHYPIGIQKLSDSEDVKLALTKASGEAQIRALSKDQKIEFIVNNRFKDVEYDVSAKSKTVQEILSNIVNGIPVITVDASASGAWSDLNWKINSNLGNELSNGFKKQLDAKVAEAKKKLNEFVYGRINAEKAKLKGQFDKIKGGLDKKIAKQKKQLDSAKAQAKNQINSQKKSAKKGAVNKQKKKAEKKLKKLLGL